MKKILLFLAGLIFINPAFAENFYIQNYDMEMNVNKDKSVNVTEVIDVFFNKPSHGIFRTIPQNDGYISDIFSSQLYTKTNQNNNIVLKLGNPNKYVIGAKKYRINYKHQLFDDKNEFYYNIIGTEWPVQINHVNFKIKMPENFDTQKVGISIGKYGTRGFDNNARYNIQNNTIIGQTNMKLNPYEGITIRIELPKDYFMKSFDKTRYKAFGIILLLTIGSFVLWYNVGRDRFIIPKVTFYQPKGINSAEAELYYKGTSSEKGITSLIVFLASQGYINIIDNKNSFTLKKLKNYDGVNPIEKKFMKNLFNSKDIVTEKDLKTSSFFYNKIQDLLIEIDQNKTKIFEHNSISFKNIVFSLFCLLGVIATTICLVVNFDFNYILTNLWLLIIFFIGILVIALTKFNFKVFIWAIGFSGIPLLIFISTILPITLSMPEIIICLFAITVCSICLKELPKRNHFGEEIKSELLGLKQFIEVAEKHRLESLIKENPSYFYDILPFAYVLDVSDKWINKFESIIQKSPAWYQGERFSWHSFNNFTRAFNSTTAPSLANGGIKTSSSGGGGFSGGGSGGGGGGSW